MRLGNEEFFETPPMELQTSDDCSSPKEITSSAMDYDIEMNPMPTRTKSKSIYKWKSEFAITFNWLEYNVETKEASCRFNRCKVYVLDLL